MAISAPLLKWDKIPATIKSFLLRALLILVAWKVLYLAILSPARILDKPLTQSVGKSSAWLLNLITHSASFDSKPNTEQISTENGFVAMPLETIYTGNSRLLSIEDGCNALELFVLYAGFLVCLPASKRDKLLFIVAGIILIYIVNIIRCACVGYAILKFPKYSGFLHHYVFTFVVYGFIMLLWYTFSKRIVIHGANK